MKRGLTKIQKERFDFIKDYIAKHGYAPTLKEMAKKYNISDAAVWYVLNSLDKKGWIKRTRHAERDIVVL